MNAVIAKVSCLCTVSPNLLHEVHQSHLHIGMLQDSALASNVPFCEHTRKMLPSRWILSFLGLTRCRLQIDRNRQQAVKDAAALLLTIPT